MPISTLDRFSPYGRFPTTRRFVDAETGHIAVLVSHNYNTHWSTACVTRGEKEFAIFDQTLVRYIVQGELEMGKAYIEQMIPYFDASRIDAVRVFFVPEGQLFTIVYRDRELLILKSEAPLMRA